MFNLFKKNRKYEIPILNEVEYNFIKVIAESLSSKYPLFKKELELGTLVGISRNPGGSEGSFTYFINNESWKKICDSSKGNFFIQGIKFRSNDGEKVTIILYVSEGLIIGYKTNIATINIDLSTIDVSNIWEKHFLNKDYGEIASVFDKISKEDFKKLNIGKNTFKIDVENGIYYAIHELGNGNYFVVDKEGVVLKATYDPFQIVKVYETIRELIDKELE